MTSAGTWLLVAYSFVSWLGGNIAWFTLPLYLKSLGYNYACIGTVFSFSTPAQASVLLFSGPLGAKLGYKRTVLFGVSIIFFGRLVQVLYPTITSSSLAVF